MIEFEDKEQGYSAIIYIMESSNSVVVHFGGFEDFKECKNFSSRIMDDLGIENLAVPMGATIH